MRARSRVARWRSSAAGSGASRCRCRRGPGTCTPTCCPATTAGRSSTPGIGLPDAKETWAAELEQLEGSVVDGLRHALPSRPHRGGGGSARVDRCARRPGRARLRAVRARVGEPVVVGAARGVVSAARRTRRRHGRARRSELRLPAVHPLPARPDPRRGRASTSTAGSSSRRPGTPTVSSASCATAC